MNLNLTTATRIGLNVLALVAVCIVLYLGSKIFIPTTIAILLAGIVRKTANPAGRLQPSWTGPPPESSKAVSRNYSISCGTDCDPATPLCEVSGGGVTQPQS